MNFFNKKWRFILASGSLALLLSIFFNNGSMTELAYKLTRDAVENLLFMVFGLGAFIGFVLWDYLPDKYKEKK